MCGISGIFDRSRSTSGPDLESAVRLMSESLRHRGPDDDGTWVDPVTGIALGFRRLAIMDLSVEGHQPMLSADGRYVIVFNGEVYNFRSLRAELEARGHSFRGHSDTEVMLAAICEWGVPSAVSRFVGMFAFAVWDRGDRQLWLVRDRVGIKPLFYALVDNALLFGSELKALHGYPQFDPEIDRDSLASYLRFGYVPSPRSIYRGVWKLLPGSLLRIGYEGVLAEPQAYWSGRSVAEAGIENRMSGRFEDAVEQLDLLLREAVKLRMEADVPLGAFLSGGIDSSTVVALMQAQSPRPVRTFTIGFRESGYDEAAHAKAVAAHLGTDHTELYVGAKSALDLIPRIPEWYDEPFADSSQLPTYLVSQMTRSHVTVALSGDGGDELFAGYDRYFWAAYIWSVIGRVPKPVRRRLAGLLFRFPLEWLERLQSRMPAALNLSWSRSRAERVASAIELSSVDQLYLQLVSLWLEPGKLIAGSEEPRNILWDSSLLEKFPQSIERHQLMDLLTYLPDDILTKVDRASMAVSLEARVPLLDHRVVEFAWRLPLDWKVQGKSGKWLLRRVLHRYVPPALVERPKMGFGVPIDIWLRGPLREWAEDLLDERRLRADGYFEPAEVRQKWSEHVSGRRHWHYPLWCVLMFQAWKGRWV